jgi:hypothetical protein
MTDVSNQRVGFVGLGDQGGLLERCSEGGSVVPDLPGLSDFPQRAG